MIQNVVITTDANILIKPLVEVAIQNERNLIEHGIKKTKERLSDFEKRFGMESSEFEKKLSGGGIEETIEYVEWLGEIKTLRLLKDDYNALKDAKIE